MERKVEIDFNLSVVTKEAVQAIIRALEAEYLQMVYQTKNIEYNYSHLFLKEEEKEQDEKQLAELERKEEIGKESLITYANQIIYFKGILAELEKIDTNQTVIN